MVRRGRCPRAPPFALNVDERNAAARAVEQLGRVRSGVVRNRSLAQRAERCLHPLILNREPSSTPPGTSRTRPGWPLAQIDGVRQGSRSDCEVWANPALELLDAALSARVEAGTRVR
jgi:hypothetical protein